MQKNEIEDEDKGEGDSGSSSGGSGSPRLKPNIELLLDSHKVSLQNQQENNSASNTQYGDWQYLQDQQVLYNAKIRKKLALKDLDSPSAMLRVVIGIPRNKSWDIENLIEAMDAATKFTFGKSLYHLSAQVDDQVHLNWAQKKIAPPPAKAPSHKL